LGQHLVDRFHKQVEVAKLWHMGMEVTLRWTLGHVGIAENEWADEEAKRAARGDSSPKKPTHRKHAGANPQEQVSRDTKALGGSQKKECYPPCQVAEISEAA